MTATPNLEAHNPVLLANGSRRRLVGRLTAAFFFLLCFIFPWRTLNPLTRGELASPTRLILPEPRQLRLTKLSATRSRKRHSLELHTDELVMTSSLKPVTAPLRLWTAIISSLTLFVNRCTLKVRCWLGFSRIKWCTALSLFFTVFQILQQHVAELRKPSHNPPRPHLVLNNSITSQT